MRLTARKVFTPGDQGSDSSDDDANGTHIFSKHYKGKSLPKEKQNKGKAIEKKEREK